MELRSLGNSGLLVSQYSLGTMTWGRDTDIHEARDQFNLYYEAGGRFIDTADVYSDGVSEEIVGEFCREQPDVLISSKAGSVRTNRRRDASRSHLLTPWMLRCGDCDEHTLMFGTSTLGIHTHRLKRL
jgi:aryl-alcohol dehydrogenase-like predicted oxidoreductase